MTLCRAFHDTHTHTHYLTAVTSLELKGIKTIIRKKKRAFEQLIKLS